MNKFFTFLYNFWHKYSYITHVIIIPVLLKNVSSSAVLLMANAKIHNQKVFQVSRRTISVSTLELTNNPIKNLHKMFTVLIGKINQINWNESIKLCNIEHFTG